MMRVVKCATGIAALIGAMMVQGQPPASQPAASPKPDAGRNVDN